MTDSKKQYRVKPGYEFGKNKEYKPGDTVELTEEEAAGFLDKLEPLTGPVRRVTTTVKKKNETKA